MRKKTRIVQNATRALLRAGGVALLFSLSCGEPLSSVPFGWELKAHVPDEYLQFWPIAVGPNGLYAIVSTEAGYPQLVAFDGSRFTPDYQTPSPEDFITNCAFFGDTGFMGVARRVYPEGSDATLLQYKNGHWEEVLSSEEYFDFSVQTVGGDDSCLLLCRRKDNDVFDIARYANGRLEVKGRIDGDSGGDFAAYSAGTRTMYAYKRGAMEAGKTWNVFVSDDLGATWHHEAVEIPPQYKLKRERGAAASPDALFLNACVAAADLEYYAVIRRTGPPGEGVYEFSYIGWVGPGVGQIDRLAFRDADHGMALGLGTSMRYDAPEWFRETSDPLRQFESLVADPQGGYWAVSWRELLWHP
jgi:hypothetical protein